jgi:tellurite resistance protein TerC
MPENLPIDVVAIFVTVTVASVYVDLFLHRRRPTVSIRDAAIWSCFWVLLSLSFAGYLAIRISPRAASLFLSGWALEKSLSVDNLMVFLAIFRAFWIPTATQHRLLYLGIVGAVFFRLIFVVLGGTAQHLLGPWVDLLFSFFVGYAAYQMIRGDGDDDHAPDYEGLWPVRLARRVLPVVPVLDGSRLLVGRARALELVGDDPEKRAGLRVAKRYMTPAFVCLLVIEWSDVMFSVDSVPVVLAVSREPLLVYSAMIFAILGLRSLYFLLEALRSKLAYLEQAVGILLVFITVKLALHASNGLLGWPGWEPSHELSTGVIVLTLAYGIFRSWLFPPPATEEVALDALPQRVEVAQPVEVVSSDAQASEREDR